jgi:hypothetical protein
MAISPIASASGLPISTVKSSAKRGLVVHQRVVQLPQKAHARHQVHAGKFGEGRRRRIDGAHRLGLAAGGTVPITSPVAGFVTSIVLPLSAAIHEDYDDWDGLCRPCIRGLFFGFRP